jgi:hypothetical protein
MIQLVKAAMENFTAKRNGLIRQRDMIRRAVEQGQKALAENEHEIIACDGAIAALAGVEAAARAKAEEEQARVEAELAAAAGAETA